MSVDGKLRRYYRTDQYRGFRKRSESSDDQTGQTQLIFANEDKQVVATGRFKEEALESVFDKIDELKK